MSRLTWVVAVLAVSGTAYAESQAEIAAKLNEEGKEAMFANNFANASAKFRQAVARVPEAKYFVNLCNSLYHEGKFSEALTACAAVSNNSPTPDQRGKADKLVGRINEEATAQGLVVMPAGGGGGNTNTPDPANPNPDPTNPNPTNPNPTNPNPVNPDPGNPNPNPPPQQAVVGRPPTMGLFAGTKPDNNYTWTLGADVYGGGGVMGGENVYGTAVAGLRLKGDYLLVPASRIGAQGYVQISHIGQGDGDQSGSRSLDVVDLGVAGYKHICLQGAENVCVTPLLGGHLAMMSPQGEITVDPDGTTQQLFNYVAAGLRAEVNLAVAFGKRQEHVLNINLGVNAYTAVFSGPADDMKGAFYYLDTPGSFGYLGLGYTYRFNTPFGSSPFVGLE